MNNCDMRLLDGSQCPNEMTNFGRWIGYCNDHLAEGKQVDREKTWDNELSGDLESGNFDYINNDAELQEILLENS